MRKQYDFSKSVKNPYAKNLKKQVTLRLGTDVIEYFKGLAQETGIPYPPAFDTFSFVDPYLIHNSIYRDFRCLNQVKKKG